MGHGRTPIAYLKQLQPHADAAGDIHLSQSECAEMYGVTRRTVISYENRLHEMGLAERVCIHGRVTVLRLLRPAEEPTEQRDARDTDAPLPVKQSGYMSSTTHFFTDRFVEQAARWLWRLGQEEGRVDLARLEAWVAATYGIRGWVAAAMRAGVWHLVVLRARLLVRQWKEGLLLDSAPFVEAVSYARKLTRMFQRALTSGGSRKQCDYLLVRAQRAWLRLEQRRT